MNRKSFCYTAVLLAFLLISVLPSSSSASDFVSFNGKFKISIPEGWERADYRTVDYVLQQSQADVKALNYEAVFSPSSGITFAEDVYLILTVDTVGAFDDARIDSTLQELGGIFGKGLKYFPVGDLMTDLSSDDPVYDPENKTVTVQSDVTGVGEALKKSLFIMKFYNEGIANFYFYSPDSLFAESKPLFSDIVGSFTTENLEAKVNTEEVKVADLKDDDDGSSTTWIPFLALGIVIIIVLSRRKRKRN